VKLVFAVHVKPHERALSHKWLMSERPSPGLFGAQIGISTVSQRNNRSLPKNWYETSTSGRGNFLRASSTLPIRPRGGESSIRRSFFLSFPSGNEPA
jgi:hypothetical protein